MVPIDTIRPPSASKGPAARTCDDTADIEGVLAVQLGDVYLGIANNARHEDACVVDQNVQPPEVLVCFADKRRDGIAIRLILRNRQYLHAQGFDLAGHCLCTFRRAGIAESDIGALRC